MNKKVSVWFILILFFILFPVSGKETEISSLIRGPVKSPGFPLIYPNAIETWYGYYRYMENEIIISFTRENILIPEEWNQVLLGELEGVSPDPFSFYFRDDNWSLLFQFPRESGITIDTNSYSVFADKFVTRLRYLLRDSDGVDTPLLPAILEF